jgi:hypothetical protein
MVIVGSLPEFHKISYLMLGSLHHTEVLIDPNPIHISNQVTFTYLEASLCIWRDI